VRSAAIAGLIRQGAKKYLDMYLDDYVSAKPRFGYVYDLPKSLSEERQMKLAALLNQPERDVAERAAGRLAKFATTKKIVPALRKGLERYKSPWGPRAAMFRAWVKVAPEEAKRPLVEYLRSDRPTNRPHDIVASLKPYLDDPEVVGLVVEIARSNRGQWHATNLLANEKRDEVVPVLLDRARSEVEIASPTSNWQSHLERVTGHIVPLTTAHNTPAKRAAVLGDWERWWQEYRGKPLLERERSNIEHALRILDVETDDLSRRAHRFLEERTGKVFAPELYQEPVEGDIDMKVANTKKLKALWLEWWRANRESFRPATPEGHRGAGGR